MDTHGLTTAALWNELPRPYGGASNLKQSPPLPYPLPPEADKPTKGGKVKSRGILAYFRKNEV